MERLHGARQRYLVWDEEDEKIQTVVEETLFLREKMRKYQRLKSETKTMIRVGGGAEKKKDPTGFNGLMDDKKWKAFISPFSKMETSST